MGICRTMGQQLVLHLHCPHLPWRIEVLHDGTETTYASYAFFGVYEYTHPSFGMGWGMHHLYAWHHLEFCILDMDHLPTLIHLFHEICHVPEIQGMRVIARLKFQFMGVKDGIHAFKIVFTVIIVRRAQSVADYLMYCEKIDPDKFKIEGKGEANPIADNNSEAGRAKNRRVEIKLLK